jgi:hypothetical protein
VMRPILALGQVNKGYLDQISMVSQAFITRSSQKCRKD